MITFSQKILFSTQNLLYSLIQQKRSLKVNNLIVFYIFLGACDLNDSKSENESKEHNSSTDAIHGDSG